MDYGISAGVSGVRHEKGKSTSGLVGERYNESDDPTRNSFYQRSWLPRTDPSLLYRKYGKPTAYMPNDVSLNIGNHEYDNRHISNNNQPTLTTTTRFARTAIITGGPLTKAGSRRAGVFLDEYD